MFTIDTLPEDAREKAEEMLAHMGYREARAQCELQIFYYSFENVTAHLDFWEEVLDNIIAFQEAPAVALTFISQLGLARTLRACKHFLHYFSNGHKHGPSYRKWEIIQRIVKERAKIASVATIA